MDVPAQYRPKSGSNLNEKSSHTHQTTPQQGGCCLIHLVVDQRPQLSASAAGDTHSGLALTSAGGGLLEVCNWIEITPFIVFYLWDLQMPRQATLVTAIVPNTSPTCTCTLCHSPGPSSIVQGPIHCGADSQKTWLSRIPQESPFRW